MKKTTIFRILSFVIVFGGFVACNNRSQTFTIQGEITEAAGKTLYLEQVGISKINLIDSLLLTSEKFKFQEARPVTPDFYRLRLDNQIITLAVDSTETIIVKTNAEHFSQDYTLEGVAAGSQNIREITALHAQTVQQFRALQQYYKSGNISIDQYGIELNALLENYKTPAKTYIVADFLSPAAYFALFQQIDNLLIFDIYDKNDNKLFGAVANAWNQKYPGSPRAEQLKYLFANARAVIRGEQATVRVDTTDSKSFFDMALPSLNEKEIRLSDIVRNNQVIIDFTSYAGAGSPAHNLQLSKIYRQYHTKGLEIYQISLDADVHLWKNAAVNLPWICVRDPQSVYSSNVQKFNVREIPTGFLMDKDGEIVLRIDDFDSLDKQLSRYFR
ncbi:hypothetical protein FACS189413_09850 [Bacteroidia bacterium]|nr:hypothetical protein FACS189413_09850 [Bacteroidia bacterium]